MATRVAMFCRQCFSLSARLNTGKPLLNQCYSNRSPLLTSVRFRGAVCTHECCRLKPPTCWKCHCNLSGHADFFCPSCDVIQPPEEEASYFEIMDRPEVFNIDTDELTRYYRALQMKLHPDRYSLRSDDERHFSSLQSSAVNRAYNTLLRPLKRGLYLLKLQGQSIEESDTSSPNPVFLMEVMELNEKLEDASTTADILDIENENRGDVKRCIKNVTEAFERGDYGAAKEGLTRLRYYTNISDQIKDRKISLEQAGEH